MAKITQEKAKEFLERINEKDRIAIIVHDDLDGLASGVLFYDFCISKGCKEIEVFTIQYGLNKITDLNLNGKNKILIADLAPGILTEGLSNLPKEIEVFYTDHHPEEERFPIPENVLELRTTNQGYIPSSRTVYELCDGKEWLAVAGVLSDFGDKDKINKEFIESFLERNKKSFEYMQKEIMYKISRVIIYFEKHKEKKFFDILKEIELMQDVKSLEEYEKPVKEEFEKFAEDFIKNSEKLGKINIYSFSPEYNIKSFLINYISSKNFEEIYIFLTPKKENLLGVSARNQSKEYDVSKILKECLEGIKEGIGGGHKSAAGGHLDKEDLEKFKENLKNYNIEKARM
jgi:single-stranded DNA-specific DHH superfamily exonuclease